MNEMPLDGVTVLDCTQVMAGPFCTMLLGDMGAEVIKVEKPEGDDSRRMGPPFIGSESAAFLAINRNKKSIILDFKKPEDVKIFKNIAAKADVVVENFRPGTMARLGIGPEHLRKDHPGLIYVSISGFGMTGKYSKRPGYDLIAQGMSGMMSVTGHPNSPPVKASIPLADLSAGMFAAFGTLSAYIYKLKTGIGQIVDTSLLDSAIALTPWEAAEFWGTGKPPAPKGSAHRLVAPYQAFQSIDGYFNIGVANQPNFARLCNAIGRPELIQDLRFKDNPSRVVNYQELEKEIELITKTKTTSEWLAILEAENVPSGPILNMEDVFKNEHVIQRDMVQQQQHTTLGLVNHLGIPTKLSATPGKIRNAAPILGEHTAEILKRFSS